MHRVVAGALALLLLATAPGFGDAGERERRRKPRYEETTRRFAPGATLTSIKNPRGPWRIHIITIDPSAATTIDVALATDELPGFETTTSMARRHGAIAAINGDYATPSGRPVFAFAEDGILAQTPLLWGRNFSVSASESASFIGHPEMSEWAHEADSDETYPVQLVNEGTPRIPQLAQFTAAGGSEERPPARACNARLLPTEEPRQATDGTGIEASFGVDEVACNRSLDPRDGVVLTSRIDGRYAWQIASLRPTEIVTVGWSLGWVGVLDTIGGNPTLIERGRIMWDNIGGSGGFFARHPRTVVAITGTGEILWVTIDGRRQRRSVGMTLREVTNLLVKRGAWWALNLDGGGSTTMVVRGEVVNRPSDGHERAVSSALLLLPGPDPGERPDDGSGPPVPGAPLPVPPDRSPRPPYEEIARDPASTGGMLAAFFDRGYGLPASLKRVVRLFLSR